MKKIDRLIKKAKQFIVETVYMLFTDNDDNFIDCLGVNPSDYAVGLPDGSIKYDLMKVLNDTAAEDWKGYGLEIELPKKGDLRPEIPTAAAIENDKVWMKEVQKKKKPKTRDLFGWG